MMTGSSKRKGDRAELEAEGLWRDHCGVQARRALGAGRKDDMGDLWGIPHTVIQVANWKNVAAAVREKPLEAETQREKANQPLAATMIRLRGTEDGEPAFRFVLTPAQYFAMWREAIQP